MQFQIKSYTCIFEIILLCITCDAYVEREKIYIITGLSANVIDVDLRSEIQGKITWILTDDHNFRLKLNIEGDNEDAIDSVDIDLTNTSSFIKLLVKEKHFSIAPAPVTANGNRATITTLLVWFLTLIVSRGNPISIILIIAISGLAPGTANTTNGFSRRSVNIEVTAPRRFTFNAVNLTIIGGKVRIVNWEKGSTGELICRTNASTQTGCSNCCHGNGVCVQNQCICDGSYDKMSSCATSGRQSLLFSHPLDPRFDRTIVPNKAVLTLGRAFQFIRQETYLKDPDKYALNIKSRDLMFPNVLTTFHSNGFIEKIVDTDAGKANTLKFKKSKFDLCVIRIKSKFLTREINVCGANDSFDNKKHIENKIVSKENEERNNFIDEDYNENRKNKRRHHNMHSSVRDLKFVHLPLRIHRCGYNSKQQKYVYFKIFKNIIDSYHESVSRTKNNISHISNENIFLLSYKMLDNSEVLRLPDYSVPLGTEEMTQKCEFTKSLQRKICSISNLESLKIVCDHLLNDIESNTTTPTQTSKTIYLCLHVLNTFSSYCDKKMFLVSTQQKSCLTNYENSLNLFSQRKYLIQPFVFFPDEKLISGQVQHIDFGNEGKLTHQNSVLVITDNDAEFKVVEISVIPKDPVPHDIYQVRLDYACATSETVIKMTVYGSDFYSNSVMCRGVTHCNCCILHAAGAPNAVIDRVTINVTDPSRSFELVRKMIVVF